MYNIKDYLIRGSVLLNNKIAPQNKKISTLMFYTTNRCNSKCKHCYMWEQQPKIELSLELIKQTMHSKCIGKYTTVGLEGGEFLLHPKAFQILQWFDNHHANYHILSNAMHYEKTIKAVTEHRPNRLYVSLDGNRDTYSKMRGVDKFDEVIATILEAKKHIPVSLMYTISPFNNHDDLNFVIKFCKQHDLDLRTGIYGNIDYFDTKVTAYQENKEYIIPEEIKDFPENYDFLKLYKNWEKGELKLPCQSLFDSYVVLPNGDIPLCQTTGKVIGNLYKETLDTIINKPTTCKLQKHYSKNCNKCWLNFHRKYDVALHRDLEKLIPSKAIPLITGEQYQWNKTKNSYKQIMTAYEQR